MDSITSMSMQQGGLGLILTILIVSAPPMAAAFFQGVLGQFSSYNQMAPQNVPQGVPASGGGAAPIQKENTNTETRVPISHSSGQQLVMNSANTANRDEVKRQV